MIMHAYFSPYFPSAIPMGDTLAYQVNEEETAQNVLKRVQIDMENICTLINRKIHSGELPKVKYNYVLREGLPEEEIIAYSKEYHPSLIVMGTRGKSQKDMDLIGSVTGEVIEIPNLYETHHVVVEASFDIAGVQVSPPDLSSQTLAPGQAVMFFWSIRPAEVGTYRGTVWLFLRFVDKVSGEESRRAVSAQLVEIEAVNLFGVPARVVRTVGGVGSVVGAVVGFPFFEDIVKFLFKKRKKQSR